MARLTKFRKTPLPGDVVKVFSKPVRFGVVVRVFRTELKRKVGKFEMCRLEPIEPVELNEIDFFLDAERCCFINN